MSFITDIRNNNKTVQCNIRKKLNSCYLNSMQIRRKIILSILLDLAETSDVLLPWSKIAGFFHRPNAIPNSDVAG